jgi:hypothetical protein
VTEGNPVSAFPNCRKTEVVLYTCAPSSTRPDKRHHKPYCARNESSIVTVSSIPIPAVEDSDAVSILVWQVSKETDEADLIVNLITGQHIICEMLCRSITFNSGLFDIFAVIL